MSRPLSVIGGFFLRALLWLGVALGVWFWAREYVVAPVVWMSNGLMQAFFPEWVFGTVRDGTKLTLLTALRHPDAPPGAVSELRPVVQVLVYCYGLPLMCALFLAARARGLLWKLPLCALMLVPFQVWGVCFEWLMVISVRVGEFTRASTGFEVWQATAFTLGYQLGVLLFPTLIPMLLWLYFERRFVTTVVVEGAMVGSLESSLRKEGVGQVTSDKPH